MVSQLLLLNSVDHAPWFVKRLGQWWWKPAVRLTGALYMNFTARWFCKIKWSVIHIWQLSPRQDCDHYLIVNNVQIILVQNTNKRKLVAVVSSLWNNRQPLNMGKFRGRIARQKCQIHSTSNRANLYSQHWCQCVWHTHILQFLMRSLPGLLYWDPIFSRVTATHLGWAGCG